MRFVIRTILLHPAVFDLLFAVIQLSIGVLILTKRTLKLGLIISIAWGLLVWWLGEGLGGLATGQALLLTGAPGAALIYSLLAIGVMPKQQANHDPHPDSWLAYAWMTLWMGGAVLFLASGANAKQIAHIVYQNSVGAPSWLARIDINASHLIGALGNWLVIVVVLMELLIGFSAIFARWRRSLGLYLGMLVALCFWVIGQSLGTYYSGLATDPNSAPLIILLGLAVLATKQFYLFS